MPSGYQWSVLRLAGQDRSAVAANVGVIVYCAAADYLATEIGPRLDAAAALHPAVDPVAVRRQLARVRAICAGHPLAGEASEGSAGDRFRWLITMRDTALEAAPVHAGLTYDPSTALRDLFRRMVPSPPR